MKKIKRAWAVVLALCAVICALPIAVQADEALLPKDESGYGAGKTAEQAVASLTNYDTLYVGADGEKTANGGNLIGLYTAFASDKSGYDLQAGKWFNKMDTTGATDAILRDSSDAVSWVAGEGGGLAYHVQNGDEQKENATKIGLTLPDAWADKENFTVEQVSCFDSFESTSSLVVRNSAFRLDLLLGLWFPSSGVSNENERYCFRWRIGAEQDWVVRKDDIANYEFAHREAYEANNGKPAVVYNRLFKKTTVDTVSYGVAYTNASYERTAGSLAEYETLKASMNKNAMPVFSLYNGTPGTFYSVRVYDVALTEAELSRNRFADLAGCFGLDLTGYMTLNESEKSRARDFLVTYYDLSSAKELLQETLDAFCKGGSAEGEDILYVTDGLSYLLTAYQGHSTGFFDNNGTLLWKNGYGLAPATTLLGTGWQVNQNGGATIYLHNEDFVFDVVDFGIVLPSTVLPAQDYTVEWVFNPIGLTVEKQDGTVDRYLDETSANGTFVKLSTALGPLRALQFVCYRPAGKDGQMERRWYYNATGDIKDLGWKYSTWDKTWAGLSMNAVKTLAVTHDHDEDGNSFYGMYSDLALADDMFVDKTNYKTNEEASGMFRLMMGMPGTAYAVRVYDRVLSESERQQNHMADLVYYYDLDASRMISFMEAAGVLDGMFAGFADIGFELTREEAQKAFDDGVSRALLTYGGVGIRRDAEGLRYYFGVNSTLAGALAANGCSIEIGALVNVNKNIAPLLDGMAYDYKLIAYDGDGGKNTGFFVDEDTFAVTLLYQNIDKSIALTDVSVRGYIRLTDANGEELVMYLDATAEDYTPNCLFHVCYAMQDRPDVIAATGKVRQVVVTAYTHETVYVNAAAGAGGDGSAAAPYRSFAEGLAKSKELLAKAAVPTSVTLLLADGEYGVYGTVSLTDEDMPYLYSELHITSENGKSTLTTTKEISNAFVKHTDNIWVCQLETEQGNVYPAFRTLYVDGKMADVSYSSDRHSFDPAPYATRYNYDFDGPAQKAMDMALDGTLTENSGGVYPTRPDLEAAFRAYIPTTLAWIKARTMRLKGELAADSVITAEDTTYASDGEKREEYESAFLSMRDRFMKLAAHNIDVCQVTSMDVFHLGKQYFDIRLVECFRDDMEAARTALAAKAAAGDTEAQASLADESWRRTALRPLNVEMHLSGQWWQFILHLSGIDFDDTVTHEDGTVHVACYRDVSEGYAASTTVGVPYTVPQASMANRYYFFGNAYEYLDTEGEYFYEQSTGKLYYYSQEDPVGKSFAYGTSDYMLRLENARNVYFEGLRFTGTDDYFLSEHGAPTGLYGTQDPDVTPLPDYATSSTNLYVADRSAILVIDSQKLTFTDCVFEELAAKGIHGAGRLVGITVEGCTFRRIGSSAIYFSNHDFRYSEKTNVVRNARIENCYFNEIATVYYTAAAVHMGQNIDCKVLYNTVEHCSYTALSLGALHSERTWMIGDEYNSYGLEVAYNSITDYMMELGDGAAIYLSGYNAQPAYTELFNKVHDNYIVMSNKTGSGLGYMVVGIYFDAASSNWHCYNNVIVAQSYGAAEGEDDGFDMSDPATAKYVKELRLRRAASTYIYLQLTVVGQITHNILCEGNYIVNVRAIDPDEQREEVYKTYLGDDRRVTEKDTHYIAEPDIMPGAAEDIIYAAGCNGHMGDPYRIYDNNY